MEFEDLQAIWDTQNTRPVFSTNESRLAVGLYQQREQSRRRLFRAFYMPMYTASLFVAGYSAFLFVIFFVKTNTRFRPSDPSMNVWDGVMLLVAFVASVTVAVRLYSERKQHERTQNVFAPSLREELEHGLSQLAFEMGLHGVSHVRRTTLPFSLGVLVLLWETGRLNGEPSPWSSLWIGLICIFPSTWYSAASERQTFAKLAERKRALQAMLSELVHPATPGEAAVRYPDGDNHYEHETNQLPSAGHAPHESDSDGDSKGAAGGERRHRWHGWKRRLFGRH